MSNKTLSRPPKKIVVITGASAGIGRATAIEFARNGWHVALLARGRDSLAAAAKDVQSVGGIALIVEVDVADQVQMEGAATKVVEAWGHIDVWVNNAMATVFSPAELLAPEDLKRVTDVTYLGSVWGTLAALRHMRVCDSGVIVQVGSALAYRSIPLQSAYCGAKSALRGFTDSLRSELIHDKSKICLTMVQLSAFNTPQFDIARSYMPRRSKPMGTIFRPEIAAKAIFNAGCNPRREYWIGWPAVQAILGTRFIPGYLDRKMAHEAYSGQLTDEDVEWNRLDNLYAPIPGDHGSNGRFNEQAKHQSIAAWFSCYRRRALMITAGIMTMIVVASILS